MVILGIDPGLERTGYSIFKKNDDEYELIAYGCITTKKNIVKEQRLIQIYKKLQDIVTDNKPNVMVIEELFYNTNAKSAISVAQAQGVMMLLAAQHSLDVESLTPLQIKRSLTGYGRADKKSVQKMVKILLELDEVPEPDDTADAIACGLAFCTIKKF